MIGSVSPDLRDRLRHVRFIGGGSGAGKSTVARRLADQFGLQLYQAEQFPSYAARTSPDEAPLLHAFISMEMDDRWVTRSPRLMFETFHGFHGEGFHLMIEDLLALPPHPPILAEGFTLLPRLVAPLLSRPGQAVWLIPTPEFRRIAFEARGSTWDIPGKTTDPERALANLLARDAIFTEELAREVRALQQPSIEVDGSTSVEDLVQRVADTLELASLRHHPG